MLFLKTQKGNSDLKPRSVQGSNFKRLTWTVPISMSSRRRTQSRESISPINHSISRSMEGVRRGQAPLHQINGPFLLRDAFLHWTLLHPKGKSLLHSAHSEVKSKSASSVRCLFLRPQFAKQLFGSANQKFMQDCSLLVGNGLRCGNGSVISFSSNRVRNVESVLQCGLALQEKPKVPQSGGDKAGRGFRLI